MRRAGLGTGDLTLREGRRIRARGPTLAPFTAPPPTSRVPHMRLRIPSRSTLAAASIAWASAAGAQEARSRPAESRESRRDQYLREFEARRRLGVGYVVTGEEMRAAHGLRAVFESVPSIVVQPDVRSGVDFRVLLRGGGFERTCSPNIWVDGMRGAAEMLPSINAADLIGMEVFRRFASAPSVYQTGNSRCGVILIWTNFPV